MKPMETIRVPKEAVKYIIFQRTGYVNNTLFKILQRNSTIYKQAVNLWSLLYLRNIKTKFSEDMKKEFSTIKKYLPDKANSLLDIGCGVAGIDVLISRHYNNKLDLYLLDKTEIDKKIYYSFKKKAAFYNSLEISKKLLQINGISPNKIHIQEATEDNKIKFDKKFDIVISIISWGFHYPVNTYIDEVYKKMKNKGILIIDIRKNTQGEKQIKKRFKNYEIIHEEKKFIRICATKRRS